MLVGNSPPKNNDQALTGSFVLSLADTYLCRQNQVAEPLQPNLPKQSTILNDPVYGFIAVPFPILFKLIEHPWFQRLRRIKQLGLTNYVYPGANNTRFHHALGALHLMTQAVEVLRFKGNKISDEEYEAVCIGILLHDIGHGPYSHTLENILIPGVDHELLSSLFMEKLNTEMEGRLSLAIQIFKDEYHKKFLHQLISSQLDVDRLDYLKRDSFYTGVYEGVIGTERIIKMLDVKDDNLVVEAKAVYSIEKFLVARRLMYWQVYLHKTVVCAEEMLIQILRRAHELVLKGDELFATPALRHFLYRKIGREAFLADDRNLEYFALLDDHDVFTSIKVWSTHEDPVLHYLCQGLVDRHLLKVHIASQPFTEDYINTLRGLTREQVDIEPGMEDFLVFHGALKNSLYNIDADGIQLLYKDGQLRDLKEVSSDLDINVLTGRVTKYYLCYPKDLII